MEVIVGPAQEIAGLDEFAVMAGTRQLQPGRGYRLSFWAKAEREYTIHATVTGALHLARQCVLRREWTRYEIPVSVADAQRLAARGPRFVRLAFEGALKAGGGRFWLDDIGLRAE